MNLLVNLPPDIHDNYRKPWNAALIDQLRVFRANGLSSKEIAREMNRTPAAVTKVALTHRFPKHKILNKPKPGPFPRITISKPLVVEYYTLNWRFAEFDGELCVMEWRASGEPRWV